MTGLPVALCSSRNNTFFKNSSSQEYTGAFQGRRTYPICQSDADMRFRCYLSHHDSIISNHARGPGAEIYPQLPPMRTVRAKGSQNRLLIH